MTKAILAALAVALAACGGGDGAEAPAPEGKQVDLAAVCVSACRDGGYSSGRWCECGVRPLLATCVCGGEAVACADFGCNEVRQQ